tara:strand:- start:51 stop:1043 length:993 start_codon:yes stop_codon:yes gene_type:complete
MAKSKQYGYYLEGNQLALVEKDVSFDNDIESKNYGPGASRQRWESPKSSIANGIEIKYAYSPTYRVSGDTNISSASTAANVHRFVGWGSDGEYLVFFCPQSISTPMIFSSNTDSYIYVTGSQRWNGLHKVTSDSASGNILTTTTKYSGFSINLYGDFSTDEFFQADAGNSTEEIAKYKSLRNGRKTYTWLKDNANPADDDALYEITFSDTAGRIDFVNKIDINSVGEYTETATSFTTSESDLVTFYDATYEQITIYEDTEVMQDESFELDLPSYLQKALVYYVKGKMAEDAGDFKLREYAMREFKKLIEKYENTRISGLRLISPGSHAIR